LKRIAGRPGVFGVRAGELEPEPELAAWKLAK
jgi:hypothetical protein